MARGYATVSEIGFPRDVHFGPFELPLEGGWGEAEVVARRKAQELGYKIEYSSAYHYDEDDYDEDGYDEDGYDGGSWDWEDEDFVFEEEDL